jgi:hypothetical protein
MAKEEEEILNTNKPEKNRSERNYICEPKEQKEGK